MAKAKPPTLTGVSFYEMTSRYEKRHPHNGSVQDMCRYDSAFVPLDGRAVVAFPRIRRPGSGSYGGNPTIGRWESFSIRLTPCDRPPDWILNTPKVETQLTWVTYQHPITCWSPGCLHAHEYAPDCPECACKQFRYGATDYGKLVPVLLKQYLAPPQRF
jgi:hypothetical protein